MYCGLRFGLYTSSHGMSRHTVTLGTSVAFSTFPSESAHKQTNPRDNHVNNKFMKTASQEIEITTSDSNGVA